MEIIRLTKKEEEWIKELKILIRKKPKSLILFADGNLNILKGTKENPSSPKQEGVDAVYSPDTAKWCSKK